MEKKIHRVLHRQLKRFDLSETNCPAHLKNWREFLERVNRAYVDLDNERYLSERTQKISNEELQDLYLKLKEKSSQLQSIFDVVNAGIIMVDNKGFIKAANPYSTKIFGFRQEALVGQVFLILIPPDKQRFYRKDMKHYLRYGQSEIVGHAFIEATGIHADGHTFPLSIAINPIVVEKKTMFVCIMRDISKEKRAKEMEEELNNKLVSAARYAGMADVAVSVLHNIGNVLNSMGVSIHLLKEALTQARLMSGFSEVNTLLQLHQFDLASFINEDEQGKNLLNYLVVFEDALRHEKKQLMTEVESLMGHLQHIQSIVAMQQTLGNHVIGITEKVSLIKQMDVAINLVGFDKHYRIVRNYQVSKLVMLDQIKLMQILVNLIRNAKDSMLENTREPEKKLIININLIENERIRIEVIDNGMGVEPENIKKIFSFGFSTKKEGHGYGLHSSVLMAKEMGGSLNVCSEGLYRGAQFILELPAKLVQKKGIVNG